MNPPLVMAPPSGLEVGWTQRIAASVAAWMARTWCALEVRGLEHLPVDEPCLLCANHTSHADTFALAAGVGPAARRLVFLAARDYFSRFRGRSWLLRQLICLLPFERGSGLGAAKHNLRVLGACRDAGRIIVLFPEGTRSPDGVMRAFKPGVAMFADQLDLRVIPCRIEGSHAMLPKGRQLPRVGALRLTFGRPLKLAPAETSETRPERTARYAGFTLEVEHAVAALGERAGRPEVALTA
jgi:long-chain acyl-CoA synthetase